VSARDVVRDHGGPELLERLDHLERSRAARVPGGPPARGPDHRPDRGPDRGASLDTDVVIAGGGLSLLLAPMLAARGLRVTVVERGTIGATHREWNASGPELAALVDSGLCSPAELEALIVARYDRGVCRWHGGGSYTVRGVLDHAVDAGALLALARARAIERGVVLLDHHEVLGEREGPGGVSVRIRKTSASAGIGEISAALLVDARGAASPYASADLVCPTVGGVLTDLDVDPTAGDILATIDDAEGGRQHVWEGFPGRAGETTVYLFYYARTQDVGPGSLCALYARFFATRPQYARGEGRMLRPTFGYIPGWSRLSPAPAAPSARVMLFGDAAARHSALTYCGFGSMLRALVPAADAIARADPRHLADAPIHAGTGALSALMSEPQRDPRALNELLDAAFATLAEMGNESYAALLQDRMSPGDFITFLRKTARRHPAVYREIIARLGPMKVGRWGAGLATAWARA